jgi:hypothetical protein
VLHGRVDERARLAALVDSARAGQAAVLVVVGDPGVGKSALLRDLVADVESDTGQPGVDVLSTSGVAAEAPLAFAALYRLLRPVLARHRLPAPQARALRVAFGQEESGGVPVEPFLVGVATLSVLTEAANDRPLLCVVDDAQWLDAASANALLFAARQLKADAVAIVFASRVGDGETSMFRPDALPVLHLGGLEPAAARRLLLEQRLGERPAQDVADRLLAESGGNPLALLELPTELSTAQLAGTAPLPPRLALTAHVEQAFLDRARRISGRPRRCCWWRRQMTPAGLAWSARQPACWVWPSRRGTRPSALGCWRPTVTGSLSGTPWSSQPCTRRRRVSSGGACMQPWRRRCRRTPTDRPGIGPSRPTVRTQRWPARSTRRRHGPNSVARTALRPTRTTVPPN